MSDYLKGMRISRAASHATPRPSIESQLRFFTQDADSEVAPVEAENDLDAVASVEMVHSAEGARHTCRVLR